MNQNPKIQIEIGLPSGDSQRRREAGTVKQLQDQALANRIQRNKDKPKVKNEDMPAGSPMYYYCTLCGAEMILDELHTCPAPLYCFDCVYEERGVNR